MGTEHPDCHRFRMAAGSPDRAISEIRIRRGVQGEPAFRGQGHGRSRSERLCDRGEAEWRVGRDLDGFAVVPSEALFQNDADPVATARATPVALPWAMACEFEGAMDRCPGAEALRP